MNKRRRDESNAAAAAATNEDDKKPKVETLSTGYVNKQRVLVFCSRGITTRYRHLMDDFRKLLPHHKKDVKVSKRANAFLQHVHICLMLALL